MNKFDSLIFYYLVIVCTWFAYDKKTGIHLFFLFVINAFVNQDLKVLFAQPRPFVMDPTVGILTVNSFGFPSGAAQVMLPLFGFLALTIRKAWFWIISSFFVFLIGISRVYLGLHFPSDILGGWMIGGILLVIYFACLPVFEKFLLRQSKMKLFFLSVIITLFLYLLSLQQHTKEMVLFGFGGSLGMLWAPSLPSPTNLFQRIERVCIALIGIYALQKLRVLLSHDPLNSVPIQYIIFFSMGLWTSFGVPLVCNFVESLRKSK